MGAEPLDVCPATPGIFDYASRGFFACSVLVATTALQDWPITDPADCVYFVDQRPLLLGLIWGIARLGLVDVAAIRARLLMHCPPGYGLMIRGGRRQGDHTRFRAIRAGEVLTAELYLTGFFPPDMLFPDPDAGPPPPPRNSRGDDDTGNQQASSEQPGGSDPPGPGTQDATGVISRHIGSGSRHGNRLYLSASAVLFVSWILYAGFGCPYGCGRGSPPGPWPLHPTAHFNPILRWMWRFELCPCCAPRLVAPCRACGASPHCHFLVPRGLVDSAHKQCHAFEARACVSRPLPSFPTVRSVPVWDRMLWITAG